MGFGAFVLCAPVSNRGHAANSFWIFFHVMRFSLDFHSAFDENRRIIFCGGSPKMPKYQLLIQFHGKMQTENFVVFRAKFSAE